MAYISKITPLGSNESYDIKARIVETPGLDVMLKTSGSSSNDSGDIVFYYGDNTEKARIWTANEYTTKNGPNYRVYSADGTNLYSGNLVLSDGTGASGTWGISITGNAATATNADKLDNLDSLDFLRNFHTNAAVGNIDTFNTTNYFYAHGDEVGFASGTNPGGHNGTAILNAHTHSGNYYTQLGLDTARNALWIRSANDSSTFGNWLRVVTNSGTWGINITGNAATASKLTDLTSADQASSSSTGRYMWFSYNDNTTGRPAYDPNFTYRSDIKTLTVPRINLNRSEATTYGRLQWYSNTYKTWTDYMSNNASGACPSGGTPSTLGNVTTWAIRSYIENLSGYGWLWESAAESNTGTPTARMALSSYDGTLEVAGLVKITKNSNTTTIGSQNANFCHIYNSANIPFIFNNTVETTTGNLGTTSYPWNNLYMGTANGSGIYYKGTKATYRMIRFIDNTNDNYGNGISIGGGGQTIIGGGESADTAVAQAGTAGAESMWICNDGAIEFYPNLQNGWTTSYKNYIDTSGYYHGIRVYGAVWNDYAEYRKDNPNEIQKPGRCVKELGNGVLALTTKRLERGCEIISDTFGFAIGQDEENGYNTPIASNGRVLAYPYESIEEFTTRIGWPVCSGPNGTVSIMTEEEEEKYPSRIIGTISEIPTYEEWGTGKVKVDGRVWIRIR